jgi:hypothetical protein
MLALLKEQSAFVAPSFGDGDPRAYIVAKSSVEQRVTRSLSFICGSVYRATPGRGLVAIVFPYDSAGGYLAAA